MFMQKEIISPQRLLNSKGQLQEAGYARELILEYHRNDVKANFMRIKEWDYYLITNDEFAVALTIADNSYMGLISISLLDFHNPWYKTTSIIKPFTFGKFKLPSSSKNGDVLYKDRRVDIRFLNDGQTRRLQCYLRNFSNGKDIECDLTLFDEPEDSMVIATPFKEDTKAFYYNQKINCMKADGYVAYDGRKYVFEPHSSFGTLDWGRGVWTYNNTWYWGSSSGVVNGKSFGFNIGYGFGDTSAASENMLFYEGRAHKLEEITFKIPMNGEEYNFMSSWTFTSSDGRFEMDFVPILDRSDYTSIGFIASDQHQVFGRFSGRAVLDDGTVLWIKDLLGFAERVANRW